MQILKRIPYIFCLIVLAYMPFHIFLAQSISLLTGGLEMWKIAKDVALIGVVLFTICLVFKQRRWDRVFLGLLGFTVAYGMLHVVLWQLDPDAHHRSAMLGILYNMRLPLCLLLGYGAVRLLPKFVFSSAIPLVVIVGTIVAGLGVLQCFLPSDVLSHLGYGLERGTRAAFFIEDRPDLPRIMSTLREPNALGAYLVVPLAAASYVVTLRSTNKRIILGGAFALQLLALFLTFSRSAWLGAAVALGFVTWWHLGKPIVGFIRRWWPVVGVLVVLLLGGLFSIRHTAFFQHYIVHSNPQEQVADLDSNDLHVELVKEGVKGIVAQPLGHGPGTAGLVSIQNPNGTQLTENYYVQVGYEVGIVGLVLFISLNVWLYYRLWRQGGTVAKILCASFWAYVLINMLLHTWSNEAVAVQWWLLTGMALAAGANKKPQSTTQKESQA